MHTSAALYLHHSYLHCPQTMNAADVCDNDAICENDIIVIHSLNAGDLDDPFVGKYTAEIFNHPKDFEVCTYKYFCI